MPALAAPAPHTVEDSARPCPAAFRPTDGRKVFSLQTLPPVTSQDSQARLAKEAGFSLHAGVAARADQRDRLERLCRYISRPAVSEKRLSLTANGQVRYQLKTRIGMAQRM